MVNRTSKLHARTIQCSKMRSERFHADLASETSVRHVHFCVFDRFKCRVLLLGGPLVLVPNGFPSGWQVVGHSPYEIDGTVAIGAGDLSLRQLLSAVEDPIASNVSENS